MSALSEEFQGESFLEDARKGGPASHKRLLQNLQRTAIEELQPHMQTIVIGMFAIAPSLNSFTRSSFWDTLCRLVKESDTARKGALALIKKKNNASNFWAFKWCCVTIIGAQKFINEDKEGGTFFNSIVAIQGELMDTLCRLEEKQIAIIYHTINSLLVQVPSVVEKYLEVIEKPNLAFINLASAVFGYCHKKAIAYEKARVNVLNTFVSLFSGSKVPIASHKLAPYKYIIGSLTVDDIKDTLVPAMGKLFLRMPNVASEVVAVVCEGVKVDISVCVSSLSKYFASSLVAKENWRRENAVKAVQALVKKIDAKTGELLGEEYLKMLEGKGIKVTNFEHRLDVCSCLLALFEVFPESFGKVFIDRIAVLLKKETNEEVKRSLVKTMTVLFLATGAESTELMSLLKLVLPIKAKATAILRPMLLNLLGSITDKKQLMFLSPLESTLKEVAVNGKKNRAQIIALTEGFLATKILYEYYLAQNIDINKDIDGLNDCNVYCSMKVLNNESLRTEDLLRLVDLCILNLNRNADWMQGLARLSVHEQGEVRYYVNVQFVKFYEEHFSLSLLKTLTERMVLFLTELPQSHFNPLLALHNKVENSEKKLTSISEVRHRVGSFIRNFRFVSNSNSKEEVDDDGEQQQQKMDYMVLVLGLFLHSSVSDYVGCKQKFNLLNFSYEHFVSGKLKELKNVITDLLDTSDSDQQKTGLNVLSFLVENADSVCLDVFVNYACGVLNSEDVLSISKKDYDIFLTPEGELCDKSILEAAAQNAAQKHQKKKGKGELYDFDDDWSDKKKAAAPIKLTKHQQEKLDEQTKEESRIRGFVTKVNQEVTKGILVLECIIRLNPPTLKTYLGTLIRSFTPLFSSILVSHNIQQMWIGLSCCCSENFALLAPTVGYATLRLSKPVTPVSENWTLEHVGDLLVRVFVKITLLTAKNKFAVIDFLYCFELFRLVFVPENQVIARTLKVVMKLVSKMVASVGVSSTYPRQELIMLLCSLISNYDFLQQQAKIDLEKLCNNASVLDSVELDFLISQLASSYSHLRLAALASLLKLELPTTNDDLIVLVNTLKFDEESNEEAMKLWDQCGFVLEEKHCEMLSETCQSLPPNLQPYAAKAFAKCMEEFPNKSGLINCLVKKIKEMQVPDVNEYDQFGNIKIHARADPWSARVGIALMFKESSSSLKSEELMALFDMFIHFGFADENATVRARILDAAVNMAEEHGEYADNLLPIFEGYLDKPGEATEKDDRVRESVVILLGTLARHLDVNDPKVPIIIDKLLEALKTPSQSVQEAVAKCLPALMKAVKDKASEIFKNLLEQLLEGGSFASRKGASYGLAGVVKGCEIKSLREHNVIPVLTEAIQARDPIKKEGALFGFETLIATLGRMFEPYIIRILPHLLVCFGDTTEPVRLAANDTAAAIVKHLKESRSSGPGVKLVLPSLLKALDEKAWRTKQGSIQMLGAMSHCAPDQLSSSLPQIVPRLIEVLADSHPKVSGSANAALHQIGAVIKNPEIQAISKSLFKAIAQPTQQTANCLQVLLNTNFVHFIDAPSLALIMPILRRALKDRSTGTKMQASQILGNMAALTNHKDLAPYLDDVLPGLKIVLVDPNPEVREASAKAMGSMVSGMGENNFSDLIPWLIETLQSDTSAVDRSGAAQGLSEVLYGLGIDRLDEFMPTLLSNCDTAKGNAREGFLMVFVHLPHTFGAELRPFVGPILPSILKGLADEIESVRDTALNAGQMIVNNYAETCLELLLPKLLEGMAANSWRIRYSSVHLLGDLLYHLSGAFGYQGTQYANDDDNLGTIEIQESLCKSLGTKRAYKVFALLFMSRMDANGQVREVAVHIWKIVIYNTVTLLRDLLPCLMDCIINTFGLNHKELNIMAHGAIDEVIRRLGIRSIVEVLPILGVGLNNDNEVYRQGVCVAISDVINLAGSDQILFYVEDLIPVLQKILCDPSSAVRKAAAETFVRLYNFIGEKAVEEVFPVLIERFNDEVEGPYGLDSLRQIMILKNGIVLSYVIPYLTVEPMTQENASILSQLVCLAGTEVNEYIGDILDSMITVCTGNPSFEDTAEQMVLSISTDTGVNCALSSLINCLKADNDDKKIIAVRLISSFCQNTTTTYANRRAELITYLLLMFDSSNPECLENAWQAVNSIASGISKEEQEELVPAVQTACVRASRNKHELAGFSINKGIEPLLPMFLHTLVNGAPDRQEIAAQGLGTLVSLTPLSALSSALVIKIIGRLIYRCGSGGATMPRVYTLTTLKHIIAKVGAQVKTFLSQLQRTFVKCLSDPEKKIRDASRFALSQLSAVMATIVVPVDPHFNLIITNTKSAVSEEVKESLLLALVDLIHQLKAKIKPATVEAAYDFLIELTEETNPIRTMQYASMAVHELFPVLEPNTATNTFEKSKTLNTNQDILCTAASLLYIEDSTLVNYNALIQSAIAGLNSGNNATVTSCIMLLGSIGSYLGKIKGNASEVPRELFQTLSGQLQFEKRRLHAYQAIKQIAKEAPHFVQSKIFMNHFGSIVYTTATTGGSAQLHRIVAERALYHMVLAVPLLDMPKYFVEPAWAERYQEFYKTDLNKCEDSDDEF